MANEIFGIDHGGPNTGIIHQNRLVLAGSTIVPDIVAASRTGEYLNFALATISGEDTSIIPANTSPDDLLRIDTHGFWFRQSSSRQNQFHGLLQQEGLLFFGTIGEATIPAGPFSFAQIVLRETSWYGSDIGRTSLIVGAQVMFLQSGGEDLRGFNWSEEQRKYLAQSLIARAGPVFRQAVDMAYEPSTGRKGETVYVIDTDGSLAVAVISADRLWPAWSTWSLPEAGHHVRAITSPLGRTTFLVDRDGVVELEILDDSREMDVQLNADGEVVKDDMGNILEGGEQTFTRTLETMPFVARSPTGTKRSVRKSRIFDCAVDYANVKRVPMTRPDGSVDMVAMPPDSVVYNRKTARAATRPKEDTGEITRVRYGGRRGWRDRSFIEIAFTVHVEIAGLAYKAAG